MITTWFSNYLKKRDAQAEERNKQERQKVKKELEQYYQEKRSDPIDH